jgi:SAM-dependent methyltransferase
MYGRLAPRYDNELRDEFSRVCARTSAQHLQDHGLHPPATILDLACGTGLTSHCLQGMGFRVTGVDSSEDMLSLARRREGAASPEFVLGDIRDLPWIAHFNAALCFGDVLNHLVASEDVVAMLASAFTSLRPGGWFLCDTNSLDTFRSRMWNNELPLSFWQGVRVRTRCFFDEEEGLGHMECQVYELGQDLAIHHLTERYYSHDVLRGWLADAGFVEISRRDYHPLDLSATFPEIETLKSLWMAQKPGETASG